jgi:hypothetical protein
VRRFQVLTSEEIQALDAILDDAIVKSKEVDDSDPVYHEVDAKGVNPFANRRTQSSVYDSLAKKGLIQCSGNEDEDVEYVCITPEGLEALKVAKGVN